ncbi:MAG: methyltransferase domain-containing protein [Pyrinomonadaceae bacterium]
MQRRLASLRADHYCPVCNSRVDAFDPLPEYFAEYGRKYGWPYREEDAETCNINHYSCPFCGASDRERLYSLYLRDYLPNLKKKGSIDIVDFGPSEPFSRFIRSLSGKISYRTADLFAEGVDDRVDITEMRIYSDNQYDFFICSHVLEHVNDDRKALRELYRILKPGGKGILMVPIVVSLTEIDEDPSETDEGERWRRFGQGDHVRIYSKAGFIERVKEARFQIEELREHYFNSEVFARAGISSKSILYIVHK